MSRNNKEEHRISSHSTCVHVADAEHIRHTFPCFRLFFSFLVTGISLLDFGPLDHPKGKMLTTLRAKLFSAAAPKLWNGPPVELCQATSLDSLKTQLKTYLLVFL